MSERRVHWWLITHCYPWWLIDAWAWCERVLWGPPEEFLEALDVGDDDAGC